MVPLWNKQRLQLPPHRRIWLSTDKFCSTICTKSIQQQEQKNSRLQILHCFHPVRKRYLLQQHIHIPDTQQLHPPILSHNYRKTSLVNPHFILNLSNFVSDKHIIDVLRLFVNRKFPSMVDFPKRGDTSEYKLWRKIASSP